MTRQAASRAQLNLLAALREKPDGRPLSDALHYGTTATLRACVRRNWAVMAAHGSTVLLTFAGWLVLERAIHDEHRARLHATTGSQS